MIRLYLFEGDSQHGDTRLLKDLAYRVGIVRSCKNESYLLIPIY